MVLTTLVQEQVSVFFFVTATAPLQEATSGCHSCVWQIMSLNVFSARLGNCMHGVECLSCEAGVGTYDMLRCLRSGKLQIGNVNDSRQL